MKTMPGYRPLSGCVMVLMPSFPARWAGLRNIAPLALPNPPRRRFASPPFRPKEPSFLSPGQRPGFKAQRAGYASQPIERPEGPR